MKNYLDISRKYLSAHKRKHLLTIISVIFSVTLITGIFSMGEVFLQFEKMEIIHDYGNYHMAIHHPTPDEMDTISRRMDVKNSGRLTLLGDGKANGTDCTIGSIDEAIAGNMSITLEEGKFPAQKNEMMLEEWAGESLFVNAGIGENVQLTLPDGTQQTFVVSGICNNFGSMQAEGVPAVFIPMDMADEIAIRENDLYLIEFKERANIKQSIEELPGALRIDSGRVSLNNHLLAVIGQSEHRAATGIYTIGAILFTIVLAAGVVMIYNTFNISVMERVRQFGLLRCVGASGSQIKRMVKREGMAIALKAIPVGVALGLLMTVACSAVLKYLNKGLFGNIPLFTISFAGMGAGIVIGFLTVWIASLAPAKKASRVSPVNAVTGSNEIRISARRKKGFLTKLFHVEFAMGMNNATMRKKTLLLMSLSISLSIIMFLGFNVFISFMHTSLNTTKPYTPDITIKSAQGFNEGFYAQLSEMDEVKKIYGRMSAVVNATFNASRLNEEYRESAGEMKVGEDGLILSPNPSWLMSYEKDQFNWAKAELIDGETSEERMNRENGLIAVNRHRQGNISALTANMQLGDKVYIETAEGVREMTVMGILNSELFSESSPEQTMATFITTEKLFTELTANQDYRSVSLQLKKPKDDTVVNTIKGMVDGTMTFLDQRQLNDEVDNLYFTFALFVYGFVVVIGLISALNIMNTMNTSVTSKIAYIGVLRATGMTGKQLNTMILTEAGTYTLVGSITGCILGAWLQKFLIQNLMTSFSVSWEFPTIQIICIFILAALVTLISVTSPIRRIRSTDIISAVNTL